MTRLACWACTRFSSIARGAAMAALMAVGRDFVEGDALDLVGLELEHVDEMPGDGLSLSVMVGGEVNEGGLGDQGLELGQDFLGSW